MPGIWMKTPMVEIWFQMSQPRVGLVGEDAAGHARNPRRAGEESHVEADGEEPEVPEPSFLFGMRPKAFGYQ